MNPRSFIDFFKTKTGKLMVFAAVFAGLLVIFVAAREKMSSRRSVLITRLATNQSDKPQVVQSVERPMEPFRPPPPKPDPPPPPPPPPPPKTNDQPVPEIRPPPLPPPLTPISLFADSAAGVPEPKSLGSIYAPFGRLIPCETVITVDSASIQTPIVGLVTEDVYHAGKLVIPAGTEVHGTAQTDRHRERIASGGSWTLVWQTGEELRLRAIALDREFSGDQEGWGITDGSAGLRGRIIKTDDMAEIKLFATTLLSGAASALTEKEATLLGSLDRRSLNNAPLKGAQEVLQVYAQRIYEAIQRDGFYVRVAAGKQFYLYVLQTIDRADAVVGGSTKPFAEEETPKPTPPPSPFVFSPPPALPASPSTQPFEP